MDLFKNPAVAADSILIEEGGLLLIKRARPPFEGLWAIPGGFVEYGERVEVACVREMREETGLEVEIIKIAGVYSDPDRDPRHHSISIVFLVKRVGGELKAADDAAEAKFFPLGKLPELAFDHEKIIEDAKKILE